jgi:hypothetical protein
VAQNDTLHRRLGAEATKFRSFPLPLTMKSIAGYVALTGEILNIPDVYELGDRHEYAFNYDYDQRNELPVAVHCWWCPCGSSRGKHRRASAHQRHGTKTGR